MSVFNLGVVFGPTLLRAVEETLAAILDIKFNNVVIEILIENYDLMFKNPPGKTTDYLSHSSMSPPEPVPRSYGGGYRSNRTSINNTQPVVRVVTRANYTDTVMSSSLQNIPNGLAIYQNTTGNNAKNHHPIYDTKPHMNQSTPSLNHVLPTTRELSVGREPTPSSGGTTYLTSASPNHINSQSPNHRSGSAGSAIISPHQQQQQQQNHLSSRDKLMQNSRDGGGKSLVRDSVNLSSPMTRSTNDGIYVQIQSQRLNPMNYSESNLVHPMSVIDRINSTSNFLLSFIYIFHDRIARPGTQLIRISFILFG